VSDRPKGSCLCCSHSERAAIDEAILRGDSVRSIGEQFGISRSTVHTHGQRHVARDDEQAATISQEGLIERLERLELHARRILSKAERAGDFRSAIASVRELRGTVDSIARITGAIRDQPASVSINLFASPEWQDVVRRVLEALAPFPEARFAVARALSSRVEANYFAYLAERDPLLGRSAMDCT